MTLNGQETITVRRGGDDIPTSLRDALRAGLERDVINVPDTSITIDANHSFALMVTTSATAVSINVPSESAGGFQPLDSFLIRQGGAGSVTFVEGSGVTINTPETLVLAKQHAVCILLYEGNEVWTLIGNLQAAT